MHNIKPQENYIYATDSSAQIPSPNKLLLSSCQRREVQQDELAIGWENRAYKPGEEQALEEFNGNFLTCKGGHEENRHKMK